MGSRIDDKFSALRAQEFTGSISDMTLQWLKANGAVSNQIASCWREMLASKGFEGQHNDAWYNLLGSLSYEGAYPDRVAAFWAAGGEFPPDPPALDPLPDLNISENDSGSSDLSVFNTGGDADIWGLTGAPAWLTIDNDGLLEWATAAPGVGTVTVTATNTGGVDAGDFDYDVTAEPPP